MSVVLEEPLQSALFAPEVLSPRREVERPRPGLDRARPDVERSRPRTASPRPEAATPRLDAPPTLDDVISHGWEGLAAGVAMACPVCGDELAPDHGGGHCQRCGSTLS